VTDKNKQRWMWFIPLENHALQHNVKIEKRARQNALGPSSPQLMTKPCPVVPVVQSLLVGVPF
jgi:hypothetical protein